MIVAAIARLRAPYSPPIARRGVRVGEEPEAKPGVWRPIFTHKSLDSVAKHMDVPVGAVVTFSAQFGTKPLEDESDEVSIRARVTAAREPFSTDDLVYSVTMLDAFDYWDMHPGVPLPSPSTGFVISPNHVEAVDSLPTPSEPLPAPPAAPAEKKADVPAAKAPAPSASTASVPWWAWVLGVAAIVGVGVVVLK
jgi:hypothetical protein